MFLSRKDSRVSGEWFAESKSDVDVLDEYQAPYNVLNSLMAIFPFLTGIDWKQFCYEK